MGSARGFAITCRRGCRVALAGHPRRAGWAGLCLRSASGERDVGSPRWLGGAVAMEQAGAVAETAVSRGHLRIAPPIPGDALEAQTRRLPGQQRVQIGEIARLTRLIRRQIVGDAA